MVFLLYASCLSLSIRTAFGKHDVIRQGGLDDLKSEGRAENVVSEFLG